MHKKRTGGGGAGSPGHRYKCKYGGEMGNKPGKFDSIQRGDVSKCQLRIFDFSQDAKKYSGFSQALGCSIGV